MRLKPCTSPPTSTLPPGATVRSSASPVASKSANFTEAAQEHLDLPVRIGTPHGALGMSDQVTGPAYATAIGLLRWGLKMRHQQNGHVPVGAGVSAGVQRTFRWLKDFF